MLDSMPSVIGVNSNVRGGMDLWYQLPAIPENHEGTFNVEKMRYTKTVIDARGKRPSRISSTVFPSFSHFCFPRFITFHI